MITVKIPNGHAIIQEQDGIVLYQQAPNYVDTYKTFLSEETLCNILEEIDIEEMKKRVKDRLDEPDLPY